MRSSDCAVRASNTTNDDDNNKCTPGTAII